MKILKQIKKIYKKCVECPECNGKGNIRIGNEEPDSIMCPDCNGTGKKMRKLKKAALK